MSVYTSGFGLKNRISLGPEGRYNLCRWRQPPRARRGLRERLPIGASRHRQWLSQAFGLVGIGRHERIVPGRGA
jgi:hypothetical protein